MHVRTLDKPIVNIIFPDGTTKSYAPLVQDNDSKWLYSKARIHIIPDEYTHVHSEFSTLTAFLSLMVLKCWAVNVAVKGNV